MYRNYNPNDKPLFGIKFFVVLLVGVLITGCAANSFSESNTNSGFGLPNVKEASRLLDGGNFVDAITK